MTQGILLLDKPQGRTSFSLVSLLRRALGVRKIGHAGTLDPFATGVMVMLVGRPFTQKSQDFLSQDKEYLAEIHLGAATNTYDCEGEITLTSSHIPSSCDIQSALSQFTGHVLQIPPMFSAKKIAGKKLYELARKGQEIERPANPVYIEPVILDYTYPKLYLKVTCSKGTYIRSLAHDLGIALSCYGHLTALRRTRSGNFTIDQCLSIENITAEDFVAAKLQPSIESVLNYM